MPETSSGSCGVFPLGPMYSLRIATLLRGTVYAKLKDEQEDATEAVAVDILVVPLTKFELAGWPDSTVI